MDPSFGVLVQGEDDSETKPWQTKGGFNDKIAIIAGISIGVAFIIFVIVVIFRKRIAYGIQKSLGMSRVNSVNSSVDMDNEAL